MFEGSVELGSIADVGSIADEVAFAPSSAPLCAVSLTPRAVRGSLTPHLV